MNFVVAADHPCLPGHFPDRPLVPGVVLLERVVEAVQAQHGALPALRLPQVKFLQPLLPGQTARVELERVEPKPADPLRADPAPAPLRWRFRVRRGEDLLASGEIVAADASAPAPAGDARA